jgi:hypothetical protein
MVKFDRINKGGPKIHPQDWAVERKGPADDFER